MADIKLYYARELKKLTFNSKPIINHLTKLAGEHTHAADIVLHVLDEAILEAPNNLKLTHLYLLDSILKNIGGPYIAASNAILYRLFCEAYRSVDEKTRQNFVRVLKTWYQMPFDRAVLEQLDKFIGNQQKFADGAAAAPLKRSAAEAGFSGQDMTPPVVDVPQPARKMPPSLSPPRAASAVSRPPILPTSLPPAAQLPGPPPQQPKFVAPVFPGRTLSEKVYLDICMLLLKKGEDAQRGQTAAASHLSVLTQLQQLFHAGAVPDAYLKDIAEQLRVIAASTDACPPLLSVTFLEGPKIAPPPLPLPPAPVPTEIMANLKRHGFDASTLTKASTSTVAFTAEALRKPRYEAITLLYQALPHQCRQCGFRFPADQKAELDSHLDWHFRMNRKLRDRSKRAISRDWFLDEVEWLRAREEDIDVTLPTATNAPTAKPAVSETVVKKKVSTPLLPDEDNATVYCGVCREKLETFWDDKTETWMVKDAIRSEQDNKLYHGPCYDDSIAHSGEMSPIE